MRPGARNTLAPWLAFFGGALVATLTGCWVAAQHGAPTLAWAPNLAAWGVGALAAGALARFGRPTRLWWPVLSFAGVAATFLSPGLSGVHRWVQLGPVRLNAAELLLPPMIVALAAPGRDGRLMPLFVIPTLAVLALQPDASQATALAGASMIALWSADQKTPRRLVIALLLAALAAVAWLRPDPLAPVPEVEGILQLAAARSPAIAGLAALALAGAVLAPLLVRRPKGAAFALTAYLALCALAPAVGAFPVPLVGLGVSPILGACLGFGLLMAARRRDLASHG